jgi:hypothetical protein
MCTNLKFHTSHAICFRCIGTVLFAIKQNGEPGRNNFKDVDFYKKQQKQGKKAKGNKKEYRLPTCEVGLFIGVAVVCCTIG